MLFKELKQGYPVYILCKGERMRVTTGKAVNISLPYAPAMKGGQPPEYNPMTMQMVVDVTVEADGVTKTYSIPETLSVTYADGIVLATSKDGIIHDVEAMKGQSVEVVNSIDKHKKIIEDCDRILEEWNPQLAETRKQDQRISGLEEKVEGIGKMLAEFINEFKK